MLSFLDGENSDAYQIATNLDNRLKFTGYGFNYYQILGLNFDYDKKELEEHYEQLILLSCNCGSFSKEEQDLIYEAYKRFTSFLGAVWYEKDVGSKGMSNVNCQYEAMVNSKKMFDDLRKQIGKRLVINYIEKKDDEFVENKIVGTLKDSHDFDNIIFECVNDFNIDFLGEQTAILKICDMSGNEIYSNKYLLDSKKRNLYGSDQSVINGFKIASWSFYVARKLDAEKQKSLDVGKGYIKKI